MNDLADAQSLNADRLSRKSGSIRPLDTSAPFPVLSPPVDAEIEVNGRSFDPSSLEPMISPRFASPASSVSSNISRISAASLRRPVSPQQQMTPQSDKGAGVKIVSSRSSTKSISPFNSVDKQQSPNRSPTKPETENGETFQPIAPTSGTMTPKVSPNPRPPSVARSAQNSPRSVINNSVARQSRPSNHPSRPKSPLKTGSSYHSDRGLSDVQSVNGEDILRAKSKVILPTFDETIRNYNIKPVLNSELLPPDHPFLLPTEKVIELMASTCVELDNLKAKHPEASFLPPKNFDNLESYEAREELLRRQAIINAYKKIEAKSSTATKLVTLILVVVLGIEALFTWLNISLFVGFSERMIRSMPRYYPILMEVCSGNIMEYFQNMAPFFKLVILLLLDIVAFVIFKLLSKFVPEWAATKVSDSLVDLIAGDASQYENMVDKDTISEMAKGAANIAAKVLKNKGDRIPKEAPKPKPKFMGSKKKPPTEGMETQRTQ